MEERAVAVLNGVSYTLIAYLRWLRRGSQVIREPHLQVNVKISAGSVPTFYYRLLLCKGDNCGYWVDVEQSLCPAQHFSPRIGEFMIDCSVGVNSP